MTVIPSPRPRATMGPWWLSVGLSTTTWVSTASPNPPLASAILSAVEFLLGVLILSVFVGPFGWSSFGLLLPSAICPDSLIVLAVVAGALVVLGCVVGLGLGVAGVGVFCLISAKQTLCLLTQKKTVLNQDRNKIWINSNSRGMPKWLKIRKIIFHCHP